MKTKQQRIIEKQKELISYLLREYHERFSTDRRLCNRIDELSALEAEPDSEQPSDVIVASSGRKYKSIPPEYDVDTWDKMTISERLKAKGLIVNKLPSEEDIEKWANLQSKFDPKFDPLAIKKTLSNAFDRGYYVGLKTGAKAALNGQIPVSK
jgi:hypothetical protein